MAWLFLGGDLAPIGQTVSFIRSPAGEVRAAVEHVRRNAKPDIRDVGRLPDSASVLDPMEAPWTTELLIDCGEWTAYLNNSIGGGDLTAIAPAISRSLDARCVGAQHTRPHGPGHAATQLWIEGPGGEPPLMYIRTLSAHCQDGRWTWRTSGTVQGFEDPAQYSRRRVADRFDRATLVRYLAALGIAVDEPSFFGPGIAIRHSDSAHTRRVIRAAEWRAENS